jgi:hypothetical protein
VRFWLLTAQNALRSIPAPVRPLAVVVVVIALHRFWTFGAVEPEPNLQAASSFAANTQTPATRNVVERSRIKAALRAAIEASPVFQKPLAVTLPKRVVDRIEVMDNYPAIRAMGPWITKTPDISQGTYDFIITVTREGHRALYPHIVESDLSYRIEFAEREIRSLELHRKGDVERVAFTFTYRPLNGVGARLTPHNGLYGGIRSNEFDGQATFRTVADAWVLIDLHVDRDVYLESGGGLVAVQ